MTIKFNTHTSYLSLPEILHSPVYPDKTSNPTMEYWNEALARDLNLTKEDSIKLINGLSDKKNTDQLNALAQAYAGHQFGHFNILGDGRAALLGEQISADGNRIDIQLKGSGRTPYSRGGDGKATLYSMLREYLIAQAMRALHVPSSRSLAVIRTGDQIWRENAQHGAILIRVASSHLRVGTFELAARLKSFSQLKSLADYAIQRHYPELMADEHQKDHLYVNFFKSVMTRQIATVTNWLRVGFIHGVMNTDNITISGETIDYGPCAFMNTYDPQTVFSSIDTKKRYAFGNQGSMLLWNLARFAESLLPLFNENQEKALALGQEVIDSFDSSFNQSFMNMMKAKMGLVGEDKNDHSLITKFLDWMIKAKADYTNSFLSLIHLIEPESSRISFDTLRTNQQFNSNEKTEQELELFLNKWKMRVSSTQKESLTSMNNANPRVIPRNHLVEKALQDAAFSDHTTPNKSFDLLMQTLSTPYSEPPSNQEFNFQTGAHDRDQHYKTFCGT
jgi:serine/tyrosine/threonine adenylyltransferase